MVPQPTLIALSKKSQCFLAFSFWQLCSISFPERSLHGDVLGIRSELLGPGGLAAVVTLWERCNFDVHIDVVDYFVVDVDADFVNYLMLMLMLILFCQGSCEQVEVQGVWEGSRWQASFLFLLLFILLLILIITFIIKVAKEFSAKTAAARWARSQTGPGTARRSMSASSRAGSTVRYTGQNFLLPSLSWNTITWVGSVIDSGTWGQPIQWLSPPRF